MKAALIVVLVLVVIALALLVVILVRYTRRSYETYSGREHQRDANKRLRVSGADRLREADRLLVDAQRSTVARGDHAGAQAIELLRTPLATLADRLRHAVYGYTPMGASDPVKEEELVELQARDADLLGDADAITELAREVSGAARAGSDIDLQPLTDAVDRLRASLDRRRAVN